MEMMIGLMIVIAGGVLLAFAIRGVFRWSAGAPARLKAEWQRKPGTVIGRVVVVSFVLFYFFVLRHVGVAP